MSTAGAVGIEEQLLDGLNHYGKQVLQVSQRKKLPDNIVTLQHACENATEKLEKTC